MKSRRNVGIRRYMVGEGYARDSEYSKEDDEDRKYAVGRRFTRPRIERGVEKEETVEKRPEVRAKVGRFRRPRIERGAKEKAIERIPDVVERKPRVRAEIRRFSRPRIERGAAKEVEKPEKKDFKEIKEEIEARFLAPKIEHFVETNLVKDYKLKASVWLESGYPVHIIGPTGCGKTTLALHLAEGIGRPVVWLNGDEEITTTDLIGGYSKVERESITDRYVHKVLKHHDVTEAKWVENPLTLACKYGYTLVYNEFSRARPEANNILLSVLEEGILELPTKFGEDKYIKVHPDFKLILTSNNIEYAGVHRPQDALLDRMPAVYMGYYDKETEIKIVQAHTRVSRERAEAIVNIIRGIRKKLKEAEKPGIRSCIMVAQGLQTMAKKGYGDGYLEQLCLCAIGSKSSSLKDMKKKKALVKAQTRKFAKD
ncbi:MAG: gas vesicle protein GvpN [Candidatus Altiarchaeales archaeon]|nr:gas vesicle protein GvpN [Candidatus Altiarchaeales archaeon]